MSTFPEGKLVLLYKEGSAAGDQTVNLQPRANVEWLVMAVWGYHDDNAAGRDSNWQWADGVHTVYYPVIVAMTNLQRYCLEAIDGNESRQGRGLQGLPFRITVDVFPSFTVKALAAGKKPFIAGIALERGV